MKKLTEKAIRAIAAKLPDSVESIACEGTALESVTYAVKKKNFLFLRVKDGVAEMRVKLAESAPALSKLAKKDPERFSVGAQGWTKIRFALEDPPAVADLSKWIEESHRGYAR
jgi:hypothetical protein